MPTTTWRARITGGSEDPGAVHISPCGSSNELHGGGKSTHETYSVLDTRKYMIGFFPGYPDTTHSKVSENLFVFNSRIVELFTAHANGFGSCVHKDLNLFRMPACRHTRPAECFRRATDNDSVFFFQPDSGSADFTLKQKVTLSCLQRQ